MSLTIRQQLGKLRTRGQLLFDRYDKLSPKWNDDTQNTAIGMLSSLELILSRLLGKFAEWQALISVIDDNADREKEQQLYDEWLEHDEYSYLMEDLSTSIAILKKFVSDRDNPKPMIDIQVSAKVAAQDIQKFDGEYKKWQPFWQRFVLNIDSKEYSSIDKLDSLFGLLEGKALDEVQGFAVVKENYETVKQTLLDRYGNTNRILYELQNQLYLIPPAKPNASSLRETVSSIHNLCRQIQNLGIDINTPTMRWDLIRKMPINERTELSIIAQTQPQTSTDDILKKMKEFELKAEIRSNIHRETSSYSNADSSRSPRSPVKSWVCSFCEGDHSSARCEKFKSMDERIKQLQKKGSCSKCAGRNHSAKECRSQTVCKNCGENHQTFLCKKPSTKTNVFIAAERNQSPLLAKEITVKNGETNKETKAVVFLDSGSQRNYVSNDLMNKLKLKPITTEVLNIEGIGGKKTSYKSKLVEIRIPTVDGSYLDLSANSIPNIAKSIPMVEINNLDPLQYAVVKKEPDILVGMEDFFSIVTSAKKQNGTVFVESKIGPMISGKLDRDQPTLSCAAITSSAAGEGLVELENIQLDEWWEFHKKKHGTAHLNKYQFEIG